MSQNVVRKSGNSHVSAGGNLDDVEVDYSNLANQVEEEEEQLNPKVLISLAGNGSYSKQGSQKAFKSDFLMVGTEQFLKRANQHKNKGDAFSNSFQSNEIDNFIKERSFRQEMPPKELIDPRIDQRDSIRKIEGFPYEQNEKRLGNQILMSKIVKNEEVIIDFKDVQEQSQILSVMQSVEEGSHFDPVQDSNCDFKLFSQFQQQKHKIVISTNQQSNELQLPSSNHSNPILESQLKSQIKSQEKKNTDSYSFRQNPKNQSNWKDSLSIMNQKQEPFKKLGSNMFESKVSVRIDEGEEEVKNNKSIEQSKKPLVQVSRMKSTYDPKKQQPQFKAVNGGYLSERDNRSAQDQPQNHPKCILDPILDPSMISQQKKNTSVNIEDQLLTKIKNLEEFVVNYKEIQKSQEKSKISQQKPGLGRVNSKQSMKYSRKIETLGKLVPDQLFGMSSIRSEQKEKPMMKRINSKDNNQSYTPKDNQTFVNNQLQFLAQKILKIQKLVSKKSQSNILDSQDQREFKGKCRNCTNSRSKLLGRSKSEKKINYSGMGNDGNIFDFDESLPILEECPTPQSSSQELAEIGVRLLDQFKINPKEPMDMMYFKSRVEYHIISDRHEKIFIIWQFTGLFYLGGGLPFPDGVVRQGRATEILPGKYIFKGNFHQNKKNGQGTIKYSNGMKYKGQWRNNLFQGMGRLTTKSSIYKGSFHLGQKHGKGKQLYTNDDLYQGDYASNKYDGVGKYTWKTGMIYMGDFKNGEMEGQGYWKSPKGDTYQGQFVKSLKHGYGRYRWKSGQIFEGEFRKGERVKTSTGIIQPQSELSYDGSISPDSMQIWRLNHQNSSPATGVKKRFTIERENSDGLRYRKGI